MSAHRYVRIAAIVAAATLLAACTASSSKPKPTSGGPNGSSVSNGTTVSPTVAKSTPTPRGTVPSAAESTRAPVSVRGTAVFGGGVTARITKISSVSGKAELPGEISGPAVAVTIELTNATSKEIQLESVVNLYSGRARTPALTISSAPTHPFKGSLAAGASATAVYTFTLAIADRAIVRIEFSYSPSAPVVLFDGSVA